MKTLFSVLLVLFAALFMAMPAAHAQIGEGCYGGGWGWGYDLGYLYNSLDYNVPYFAAHPPVYYSYPVPRTYGYSPFAYPPTVKTPDVSLGEPHPVQIINPYVPKAKETAGGVEDQSAATAPPTSTEPQPLVIINPYVTGAGKIARVND